MRISTTIARSEFTNAILAIYKERVVPMSFLRSFFKNVEKSTLALTVTVQRGTEKVAVAVQRGTNGNRVTFSKATDDTIVPPYYYQWFSINELDVYKTLFTSSDIDVSVFTDFLSDVVEKMKILQDTIERAYEKQCSEVFETGIVLHPDVNIDFRRKSGSKVDLGAGGYWTVTTVDPMLALENAGKFIRESGKAQGGVYNAILGGEALRAMLANPNFKSNMDLKAITYGEIMPPQRNAVGGTLHGRVSAGTYSFNIWSYNDGYEDAADNFVYYVNPKIVVVIPENPNFVLGFALVPQLPSLNGGLVKKGAYVFTDRPDANQKNHIMECESTGLAWPVAIDQIYTFKAVA